MLHFNIFFQGKQINFYLFFVLKNKKKMSEVKNTVHILLSS